MKKNPLIILILLGAIALSCNVPGTAPSEGNAMTAAALTVDAALSTPGANPLPSPTGLAGTTTPPFSQPMLSVGEATNCRSGPNPSNEKVVQLMPGQQVVILGSLPPDYWLVNTDQGDCWIPVKFATPVGNYLTVPTVTAPPTPNGLAPDAPTFPQNAWSYFCYGADQADITLSWNDKADNEAGYRILRNGEAVADLPPNSTSFKETIKLASGQSVDYQIQAYNVQGESNSPVAHMTCP